MKEKGFDITQIEAWRTDTLSLNEEDNESERGIGWVELDMTEDEKVQEIDVLFDVNNQLKTELEKLFDQLQKEVVTINNKKKKKWMSTID